jgi:hypothetical protein
MTFVVVLADGSVDTTANSYVSVADARAMSIQMYGEDEFPPSDETNVDDPDGGSEALLMQATFWLDRHFGGMFIGWKRYYYQNLQWLRYVSNTLQIQAVGESYLGTLDSDGNPRDWNQLPIEIANATVDLALMLQDGFNPELQNDAPVDTVTKKLGTLGPMVETKYVQGFNKTTWYPLHQLLRPLLKKPGSVTMVRGK